MSLITTNMSIHVPEMELCPIQITLEHGHWLLPSLYAFVPELRRREIMPGDAARFSFELPDTSNSWKILQLLQSIMVIPKEQIKVIDREKIVKILDATIKETNELNLNYLITMLEKITCRVTLQ